MAAAAIKRIAGNRASAAVKRLAVSVEGETAASMGVSAKRVAAAAKGVAAAEAAGEREAAAARAAWWRASVAPSIERCVHRPMAVRGSATLRATAILEAPRRTSPLCSTLGPLLLTRETEATSGRR